MTSLSAGIILYDLLSKDEEVKRLATKVFPVVTDKAELPYVAYRRSSLSQVPVKTGLGADTITIEVGCYATTYAESVALAEAVRAALDNRQGESSGLRMRSCTLSGAEGLWENDAFVQMLTFTVKV